MPCPKNRSRNTTAMSSPAHGFTAIATQAAASPSSTTGAEHPDPEPVGEPAGPDHHDRRGHRAQHVDPTPFAVAEAETLADLAGKHRNEEGLPEAGQKGHQRPGGKKRGIVAEKGKRGHAVRHGRENSTVQGVSRGRRPFERPSRAARKPRGKRLEKRLGPALPAQRTRHRIFPGGIAGLTRAASIFGVKWVSSAQVLAKPAASG